MINKDILANYIATLNLFSVVRPDQYADGRQCYLAEHRLLPGCMSHGETPADALENLKDACVTYLEGLDHAGRPIPEISFSQGTFPSGLIWQTVTEEEALKETPILMAPTARVA